MLLGQLPPESATATAMRLSGVLSVPEAGPEHDAEAEQWSRAEQLLAAVKDELTAFRYSYTAAHSKQKPRWKPTPTPRPGVKPKRKRAPLNEEQLGALEAYLARTQGAPEDN